MLEPVIVIVIITAKARVYYHSDNENRPKQDKKHGKRRRCRYESQLIFHATSPLASSVGPAPKGKRGTMQRIALLDRKTRIGDEPRAIDLCTGLDSFLDRRLIR